jgi:hypothetical protein
MGQHAQPRRARKLRHDRRRCRRALQMSHQCIDDWDLRSWQSSSNTSASARRWRVDRSRARLHHLVSRQLRLAEDIWQLAQAQRKDIPALEQKIQNLMQQQQSRDFEMDRWAMKKTAGNTVPRVPLVTVLLGLPQPVDTPI